MENPLSKLALDAWYKVLIMVGSFTILLNGAGLLPAYPTRETFIIAFGSVVLGIGEWINHPLNETAYPRTANMPAIKLVDYSWRPSPVGIIFDIIGAGMILRTFYKLI